jgi:hypothetical protein
MQLSPSLEAALWLSYSRISQNVMKADSSLPFSQELSTGPYPDPE